MYSGDVLIHIDDSLDDEALDALLLKTREEPGVLDARVNEGTRHLMVVDFDAKATSPSNILQAMRQRGVGAELIGL
ncbi:hypothetical protein [Halochromatium sp.]